MKKTLILIALAPLALFGQDKSVGQLQNSADKSSEVLSKGGAHGDSPVHWVSFTEAIELQKTNPKKIMVDVYTKWCGPCKMMSANTFTDDEVSKYLNDNYYAVKFDAESADTIIFNGYTFANPEYNPAATGRNGVHQLTQYLNVNAYPTLVFFDEKAQYLGPVAGYRTPPQIELFLKFFSEGKYMNIKTQEEWQAYESSFVPTWN
jgi:thioredoxin-related protein